MKVISDIEVKVVARLFHLLQIGYLVEAEMLQLQLVTPTTATLLRTPTGVKE